MKNAQEWSPEISVLEIYCRNPNCCVRNCEVLIKEYNAPAPADWRCPGCGRLMVVHWQRTTDQHMAVTLQTAIGLVNAALYKRDYPEELASYPLSVFIDQLPDSWKCTETKK